jgi:hypothetical protein
MDQEANFIGEIEKLTRKDRRRLKREENNEYYI